MAKKKKTKPAEIRRPDKTVQKGPRGKSWIESANAFLEKQFYKVLAGICVLSLALSAVYYIQGHNTPLKSLYTWQNSDMNFFDQWAVYLSKGNWWCDTIIHPYHDWHDDFAKMYLEKYPDVAATYYAGATKEGVPDTLAARHALINDIYKGKTYHQEPLYTYMLAFTYALFGHHHEWVYFWQFLFAAFTGVLIYLVGKRFFSPVAGLLGALFYLGCATIMVFEMVLLRTTLTNFFTMLLLYTYLRALDQPGWRNQVWFGVSSGVALLAQSYFILFLVPAWAWLAWTQRKQMKQVSVQALAFMAALLITMSPLVIRNLKVGVPPFAMAGHGAMAYIPMNTKYAAPMESFFIDIPSYVKLRHDGNGKMIKTALACLGTFDTFGSFWKVYSQKINGLFMWYEIPNNMSYYMFREYASILKILPVRYYLIAPLGLAGLALGLYRYRWKFVPFLIMVVASIFPLFIAGNLARYRTPLVILMCLAAAFFIFQVLQWFREQKRTSALIGLGVFLLAFLYTSSLVKKTMFVINTNDLDPMYKLHFANRLLKLEQEQNDAEYLKLTTELMTYIPDYFFNATLQDPIKASNEAEACRYVAGLMNMHAGTLELMHQDREAAYYKDRVAILNQRADHFMSQIKR